MKKLMAVAALSLFAVSAYADPGGSITGHAGAINGTASSISTGSSVAATQINGYGSSTQVSFGMTGGVAEVGGSFSRDVSGNAPIMVGDSIANGSATFAQTDTSASATGSFHAVNVGAFGSIHGIGPVGHVGGFNH
jgi:hypothetical protein